MWVPRFTRITKMTRAIQSWWDNQRVQQRWGRAKWEPDSALGPGAGNKEVEEYPSNPSSSQRPKGSFWNKRSGSCSCFKPSKDSPLLLIKCKQLHILNRPCFPYMSLFFYHKPTCFLHFICSSHLTCFYLGALHLLVPQHGLSTSELPFVPKML